MIDCIWILGKGSIWNDTEIRYSLRSIVKHLKNYRNIYIIGELPEFIQNVRYAAMKDEQICKEHNIYRKVLRACEEKELSDNFLFFNDDHFLLQDFDANEFPDFYKGTLRESSKRMRPGNRYKQALDNTYRILSGNGLDTKNFDTHSPMLFNKQKFLDIMPKHSWTGRSTYVMKSLYANSVKIEGTLEADCKIQTQNSVEDYMKIIEKRKVFSIGNGAIGNNMLEVLNTLYPQKSKFEK